MNMREHGGDLDRAQAVYGGTDWLDLSTGINPTPYPVPAISDQAWQVLPTASALTTLEDAARAAYGATGPCMGFSGAQAIIQLVPRLLPPGKARVLSPTYNEHGAALSEAGWQVQDVDDLDALRGATLAVIVNPNNPDGRRWSADTVMSLAADVGLLVVDESFADPHPDCSVIPALPPQDDGPQPLVLRSFGKFYGLAGLRLGFALGAPPQLAQLRQMAGPWSVSGPALEIGCTALRDTGWRQAQIASLAAASARLDALVAAHTDWSLEGGSALFRTYRVGSGAAVQDRLAQAHIWTRKFTYAPDWLRLGLPGGPEAWDHLEAGLRSL